MGHYCSCDNKICIFLNAGSSGGRYSSGGVQAKPIFLQAFRNTEVLVRILGSSFTEFQLSPDQPTLSSPLILIDSRLLHLDVLLNEIMEEELHTQTVHE